MYGDRLGKLRMFENRVLKGSTFCSSSVIRVIRVRLVWHEARMGERRVAHKVLAEKTWEGDHLENLGFGGTMI